jgi:hypothetical protein
MKNRAKCRQCETIIESFHSTHLMFCKCGKIGVDGGDALKCMADDWNDFIRVDDDGNEIIPKINNPIPDLVNQFGIADLNSLDTQGKPSKEELLKILDEMIKSYESLPDNAMYGPINHFDMLSVLLLVSSILRS